MFWKPLKLKMRSPIFIKEIFFENDNYLSIDFDLNNFGIGFDYRLGDSRRHFTLDLLFLHLEVLF